MNTFLQFENKLHKSPVLKYGNKSTKCYAVKAPCILYLFTRWGICSASVSKQTDHSNNGWAPRELQHGDDRRSHFGNKTYI